MWSNRMLLIWFDLIWFDLMFVVIVVVIVVVARSSLISYHLWQPVNGHENAFKMEARDGRNWNHTTGWQFSSSSNPPLPVVALHRTQIPSCCSSSFSSSSNDETVSSTISTSSVSRVVPPSRNSVIKNPAMLDQIHLYSFFEFLFGRFKSTNSTSMKSQRVPGSGTNPPPPPLPKIGIKNPQKSTWKPPSIFVLNRQ